MEEPLSDNVFAGAAARAAALQRLQQRAAAPAATLAETQALLAESLTQQATLLQELQRAAQAGAPAGPEPVAANDHYRALFNAIDKGFCLLEIVYDAQGTAVDSRVLEVNPTYEQLTGLAGATGRLSSEIAPGSEATWLVVPAEVVRTGQVQRFQQYHQPTGRWYETYTARVGGAGSRQAGIVLTEITGRKQAEKALQDSERRHSFLLQLSDALGPLTDAMAIQEAMTQVTREFFQADRCYYGEIQDGHCLIRRDASAQGLPSVAGEYELRTMPLFGAMVATGQPLVVENAQTSPQLDDSLRQLCEQLQIISFVDIPVVKNGQLRGLLCVAQGKPRRWTPLEVALTQETAERIWTAIERGHAKEALHASEARLRIALEAAKLGT